MAFSPDGQRVLTASADHTARVWDASTGTNLLVLNGHGDQVRGVAFSPDGRRLLTGSWDQTAKIWDAETGQDLLTLKGQQDRDRVHSVAFSPDGRHILTGNQVWEAATPDQVAAWRAEEKEAAEQQAALDRQRATADEQTRLSTAKDPGAIKQWLVLGPLTFEGYNGTTALAEEQIDGEGRVRPSDGRRTRVGTNDLAWQAAELDDYRISFSSLFRSMAPSRLAYLVCYIVSEADQTGLLMKVGSESQSKVYLNGNEIYRHDKARKFVPDQDVVTDVKLIAGLNVVVFKVVDENDLWRASLRLTDAGGQPLKGIRVTLTPPSQRQ
jgi:WD40 repeat protein